MKTRSKGRGGIHQAHPQAQDHRKGVQEDTKIAMANGQKKQKQKMDMMINHPKQETIETTM
jgi:hypothetical protein